MTPIPVFDGHNDLLARLHIAGGVEVAGSFSTGRARGHIDAQKMQSGTMVGGLFALWVPGSAGPSDRAERAMRQAGYDVPLPPPVDRMTAAHVVKDQLAILRAIETGGGCTVCVTVDQIEKAIQEGIPAAVIHLEGAEAIGPEFDQLDDLVASGLRSLGPVWSRPTIFGHGVPFRFPATPDIGPGLTDDGKRLVKRCTELKILVDVAHLNEAGFWDVAALIQQPIVATHSNVHALCPHARNLTDCQLDAITESDGLVGLNFATAFLREDGRMRSDTPIDIMVDHLAYLVDRMGETRVALGSDFDGAVVPREIGSAAGLQKLVEAMRHRGFDEPLIENICWKNWLRVLRAIWGA
ncbi:MAG: dipeptidase [Pseudomonadota bacterium]